MRHSALGGVDHGPAELLLRDFFAGDALYDGGSGKEHVRGILDHEGEVSEGGGVYRSAGAGAEDAADLRHDTGGKNVALKDVAVAGEGVDAFLDAGSARIVQADARGAVAYGEVHDLADLLRHGLGKGTS